MLVEIGSPGTYELVPFPGDRKAIDIGDYYSDFHRIHALLGWAPRVGLREGLRKTIDYYREHRSHYWG